MERLLTDEEIQEARDRGWEHYISRANRQHFTDAIKEELSDCERRAITEAQRDLTRKATLKAVGEWLENRLIKARALDVYLDFKHTFLRGEMPEEKK